VERLTPTGRATYVLREAFDYAYADIADITQLSQAAAQQLVSRADSGGVVRPAARVPVVGRRKVARLLEAYAEVFWAGVTLRPLDVNNDVAVGLVRDGKLFCVLTLTASDRGVDEVLWQMNPAKLERVQH